MNFRFGIQTTGGPQLVVYNQNLYFGSAPIPPWCRGESLDLWSKGQRFEPQHRQHENVINLDENSWSPTKIIRKRSFSKTQKHWRGWHDNACLGVRNTSSIGAWHNSLNWRPPWYCIVSPLLQNRKRNPNWPILSANTVTDTERENLLIDSMMYFLASIPVLYTFGL